MHCGDMARTLEEKERDQEVVREVLRELEAMPPGRKLTGEELLAFLKRLPKLGDMPEGWSSADDIREFRGPLPDDDPLYQRNILGRRERFDAVPFFWTRQYGISVKYVGHAEKWDDVQISGSLEARDCTVTYRLAGRTVAVATIARDLQNLQSEAAMETQGQAAALQTR